MRKIIDGRWKCNIIILSEAKVLENNKCLCFFLYFLTFGYMRAYSYEETRQQIKYERNEATNMEKKLTIKDYLKSLGPGAIMAAAIIGPGTVTTASTQGANYGY